MPTWGAISLSLSLPIATVVGLLVKRRAVIYRKVNCEETIHLPKRISLFDTKEDYLYSCKICWNKRGIRAALVKKQPPSRTPYQELLLCENCNANFRYPASNSRYVSANFLGDGGYWFYGCAKHMPKTLIRGFLTTEEIFAVIAGDGSDAN